MAHARVLLVGLKDVLGALREAEAGWGARMMHLRTHIMYLVSKLVHQDSGK